MTFPAPSGEIPLSRLIQDLEDGVISSSDRDLLMDQLRHDPEARELYLKQIKLAALLHQTAETRVELGTMPVSMEMLARAKRKSAITALAGGLAAVLILALTLMAFQVRITIGTRTPRIAMDRSQDATYEIDWADDESRAYDQLRPGDHITLERGLLRFTFPSQVEAIIEGPTDLELLSSSEIRLNGGNAWFRVPEAGRGFTVRTDRAKIVDLGTEFGLSFDHEKTVQVHVAQGKVRVEPLAIGAPDVELTDGQAIRIDALGRTREVDYEVRHFRREFTHAIPYLHWSFDFLVNGTYPATGTLPDLADFRARLQRTHGDLTEDDLRLSQAEGMRGQAFAMHGDGRYATSTFPGIGGNAPRTVAAWIRHRGGNVSMPDVAPFSDSRTGHGASTPFGDQAYLLNYTNTGLVTAHAAIGEALTAGTTYTLAFHTAALPEIGIADYLVELVAFDPAHDDHARMDMRQGYRAGTVLAQSTGQTTTSDMATRDEITFTAQISDPHIGKEIAIRLVKSGGAILFDNLNLTRRNAGGEVAVIFEESFESPVVCGYAEHTPPAQGWIGPPAGQDGRHLGFGANRHGLFSQRPVFSTAYVAWDGGRGSRFAAFTLPAMPLRWSVTDCTRFSDSPASSPILPGEWTHIATVQSGRTTDDGHPEILHYINGKLVDGGRYTAGLADFPSASELATLHIGIHPAAISGSPTLDGDIDELFIFRGALDASEIQSLMEDNRAVFPRKR